MSKAQQSTASSPSPHHHPTKNASSPQEKKEGVLQRLRHGSEEALHHLEDKIHKDMEMCEEDYRKIKEWIEKELICFKEHEIIVSMTESVPLTTLGLALGYGCELLGIALLFCPFVTLLAIPVGIAGSVATSVSGWAASTRQARHLQQADDNINHALRKLDLQRGNAENLIKIFKGKGLVKEEKLLSFIVNSIFEKKVTQEDYNDLIKELNHVTSKSKTTMSVVSAVNTGVNISNDANTVLNNGGSSAAQFFIQVAALEDKITITSAVSFSQTLTIISVPVGIIAGLTQEIKSRKDVNVKEKLLKVLEDKSAELESVTHVFFDALKIDDPEILNQTLEATVASMLKKHENKPPEKHVTKEKSHTYTLFTPSQGDISHKTSTSSMRHEISTERKSPSFLERFSHAHTEKKIDESATTSLKKSTSFIERIYCYKETPSPLSKEK